MLTSKIQSDPTAIGFAIAPCAPGFVIVAVSGPFIRSIMVGDDPQLLVGELQNKYPHDDVQVDEYYDVALMAKIVGLIEHPECLDLPLDIRGTNFQTRVWDALQSGPAGTAVSYTFLAEHLTASASHSDCMRSRLAPRS
jgi:AraC family transcriptional regulator of adaptative response/methylated-DNA-[protein]-cysteine methyltransferase